MTSMNIVKPVNSRFSTKYDVRYMVDEFKERNQICSDTELQQVSKRELRSINKSIYNSPRFNLIKDELLNQMENRYIPSITDLNNNNKASKYVKNLDIMDITYDDIIPMSKVMSGVSILKTAYCYNKFAQEYYSNNSASKIKILNKSKENKQEKRKSN